MPVSLILVMIILIGMLITMIPIFIDIMSRTVHIGTLLDFDVIVLLIHHWYHYHYLSIILKLAPEY